MTIIRYAVIFLVLLFSQKGTSQEMPQNDVTPLFHMWQLLEDQDDPVEDLPKQQGHHRLTWNIALMYGL